MSATGTVSFTRALAERCCSLSYEELPDDVSEIARQCLLDWLGVALGGSSADGPRTLLGVLGATGETDRGTATVVGYRGRLPPLEAALVNGTSSHVLDFDDVNIAFLGHLSVSILAAALALAEQLDANAAELLTAFVAGYETASRIALALGPEPYRRGYHSTATIGTFAATAASARLLELDGQRTALALGIAASTAAGLKCNFGTMTKSLHAGKACENGLLAAMLAARGFTANPAAIEADQGFARVMGGRCEATGGLADQASGWHIRENLFKYHASCFFTHSMIEGLGDLASSGRAPSAEIEQISVHVSELELGTCAIPAPRTGLEVKFSLAHLAAMTLLGRATSTITDEDAHDQEVIGLRSRVVLIEDGAAGEPTRVDVILRDCEVASACSDVTVPATELGDQRGRLAAKFISLAEPAIGSEGARRLLAALSSLDRSHGVRALMALTRPDPAC